MLWLVLVALALSAMFFAGLVRSLFMVTGVVLPIDLARPFLLIVAPVADHLPESVAVVGVAVAE